MKKFLSLFLVLVLSQRILSREDVSARSKPQSVIKVCDLTSWKSCFILMVPKDRGDDPCDDLKVSAFGFSLFGGSRYIID